MVEAEVNVNAGVIGGHNEVFFVFGSVRGGDARCGISNPPVKIGRGQVVAGNGCHSGEAREVHVEALGLFVGEGRGEIWNAGRAGPTGGQVGASDGAFAVRGI